MNKITNPKIQPPMWIKIREGSSSLQPPSSLTPVQKLTSWVWERKNAISAFYAGAIYLPLPSAFRKHELHPKRFSVFRNILGELVRNTVNQVLIAPTHPGLDKHNSLVWISKLFPPKSLGAERMLLRSLFESQRQNQRLVVCLEWIKVLS